jgi:uncharacterized protein YraI
MRRLIILGALLLSISLIGIGAKPVQAQTTVWTSEFFNNIYLLGSPVYTRQDTQLSFNWGIGSPYFAVPTDYFSARFSGDVYFFAGTYRFTMIADDGGRVFVNGIQVINTFDNLRPNQIVTGDFNFPINGYYRIMSEYIELTGSASFALSWQTAGGVPTPTPPPAGSITGVWTGTYYNTSNFTGPTVATVTDSSITKNWGTNAPLAGVNADNFSVRWTSTQYLPAGSYRIDVNADDGVRVYVDNQMVINELHVYLGQRYSYSFTVATGRNYPLTVEYQEGTGGAFLEFSLTSSTGGVIGAPTATPNIPTTSPTGLYGVVNTSRLNVRNIPSATGSSVLTRVSGGEVYILLAYSTDNNWAQLNVNGIVGWVNVRYMNITSTPNVTSPTGVVATTSATLNMRLGPDSSYGRIVTIPNYTKIAVIGRNASNTWWQVTYNGQTGWVSAQYAPVPSNSNLSAVPVTG